MNNLSLPATNPARSCPVPDIVHFGSARIFRFQFGGSGVGKRVDRLPVRDMVWVWGAILSSNRCLRLHKSLDGRENHRNFEGGVAGVVRARRVMFRGLQVKFETTFVKQNQKLVHKCGFRFSGRSLERAEQKPRNLESGPQNLDFRGQVEKLTLFRGASEKSKIRFVSLLPIMFHNRGLSFIRHPSEDHGTPQNDCYSTLGRRLN